MCIKALISLTVAVYFEHKTFQGKATLVPHFYRRGFIRARIFFNPAMFDLAFYLHDPAATFFSGPNFAGERNSCEYGELHAGVGRRINVGCSAVSRLN